MRRPKILAGIFLLVSFASWFCMASPRAEAQEGGGGECELDPVTLNCRVTAPVPGPSGPSRPGGSGDRPDGGSGPTGEVDPGPTDDETAGVDADCAGGAGYLASGAAADQYRSQFPDAPADQNFYVCQQPDGRVRVRLAPAGAEAPPPDPAEVAANMLVEAQAQMRAPEVVADPPVGTPSIITLPVFVQVTNWVDGFEVGPNCVQGVCVTLTAEPTLTFDPGEPGSEPIVCEPPGTRFDPNGPDPAVQAAAPGACAYAYQARTGADERPDAWPARVTVTWNVAWTANGAGDEFPPYPLSTEIPREVNEVQTVVRD